MISLIKWVFPIILCATLPAYGGGITTLSNAEFLNHPDTKSCKITAIHEDFVGGETKLFANVELELKNGEKSQRSVPASYAPADWSHNDANKFSKRVVEAYVICHGEKLEKEYTKAERFRYTPLKEVTVINLHGSEVKDIDLPLGVKADMVEHQEFKRADGSIYKLSNVIFKVMALAKRNGKVVAQSDLLQLPAGTSLDVFKNIYIGDEPNPSDKILIYKLVVQDKTSSREAWVCMKEQEQITFQGGFFKNPQGTKQLRHFPQQFRLTDYWKEVYKVSLTNPAEIPFLKGDIYKRTKKYIQTAPKDVGHCDGKFENYQTIN